MQTPCCGVLGSRVHVFVGTLGRLWRRQRRSPELREAQDHPRQHLPTVHASEWELRQPLWGGGRVPRLPLRLLVSVLTPNENLLGPVGVSQQGDHTAGPHSWPGPSRLPPPLALPHPHSPPPHTLQCLGPSLLGLWVGSSPHVLPPASAYDKLLLWILKWPNSFPFSA